MSMAPFSLVVLLDDSGKTPGQDETGGRWQCPREQINEAKG